MTAIGTICTILRSATADPMNARKTTALHSARRTRIPGFIHLITFRSLNLFHALGGTAQPRGFTALGLLTQKYSRAAKKGAKEHLNRICPPEHLRCPAGVSILSADGPTSGQFPFHSPRPVWKTA